jgi:hypothetical protein
VYGPTVEDVDEFVILVIEMLEEDEMLDEDELLELELEVNEVDDVELEVIVDDVVDDEGVV